MVIKLVVVGAEGRMGSQIIRTSLRPFYRKTMRVIYGIEAKLNVVLNGNSLTKVPPIGADLDQISNADVVIDFTNPKASLEVAAKAAQLRKCLVIGTTGFSPRQERELHAIVKNIPVVKSPNMSWGMNVMFKVVKDAARVLEDYDIQIRETHHIHKKDKPSGTALRLKEIIEEFSQKNVAVKSIRRGEIIGDHTVAFSNWTEEFAFTHKAKSRAMFARGALRAARWVINQKPGLYTMQDVLGLND